MNIIFTLAACGKSVSGNTTVSESTTAESVTAANETTAVVSTTSHTLPVVKPTAAVTGSVQKTTAVSAGIAAPVGTDIARIVAFYNQYANLTRVYPGTVAVAKMTGSISKIIYIAAGKSIAERLLPNNYGAKPDLTFTNGKSGSIRLIDYLPRKGEAKMSVLEPAGVKSASCAVGPTGWAVTITLKSETLSGPKSYVDRPKYHYQCMDALDLLNFSPSDFKPFTFKTATVTYTDATTIQATVNSKGLLDNLHILEPARILVDLTWGFIKLKNTDVLGIFQEDYIFTYVS
ncbi:MAG: hypothetical protein WCN92_03745 [Eubacteriales bacterium]